MYEMPMSSAEQQDTLKVPDTLKSAPSEAMYGEKQTLISDLEEMFRAMGNEMVNLSDFREVAGLVIDALKVNPGLTLEQANALFPSNPDLASEIFQVLTSIEPTPPTDNIDALEVPRADLLPSDLFSVNNDSEDDFTLRSAA